MESSCRQNKAFFLFLVHVIKEKQTGCIKCFNQIASNLRIMNHTTNYFVQSLRGVRILHIWAFILEFVEEMWKNVYFYLKNVTFLSLEGPGLYHRPAFVSNPRLFLDCFYSVSCKVWLPISICSLNSLLLLFASNTNSTHQLLLSLKSTLPDLTNTLVYSTHQISV